LTVPHYQVGDFRSGLNLDSIRGKFDQGRDLYQWSGSTFTS
jgi:hypothetical protein